MNILVLSSTIPISNVRHAGGKTFYYYMNKLNSQKDVTLRIHSLATTSEIKQINDSSGNIKYDYSLTSGKTVVNFKRVIVDMFGCAFKHRVSSNGKPLSYYKQLLHLKACKKYKSEGFYPDVIILEWTNSVLLAFEIKKIFPEAHLVASEHDVSFLGAERRYLHSTSNDRKKLYKQYLGLKKEELEALGVCDVVMPHNFKDKDLLVKNGIDEKKIHILTPYYHNMANINHNAENCDVLFWGAMNRSENSEAAIWFIKNVMPLIKDTRVRFVVAGNNPPQVLRDYSSDNVLITGFVEDETKLFSSSMCFVAPLINGAGIKVKVLEAFSSGIPVLTNDVGIEGIPAKDGKEYFHCVTPQEYADVIIKIADKAINIQELGKNQHQMIHDAFDLDQSFDRYLTMLKRTSEN